MESDTKKLLEDALKLPDEARAALAGSLIDSLDDTVDPDAESVWAEEIDRGKVKTVPWFEARRQILGR